MCTESRHGAGAAGAPARGHRSAALTARGLMRTYRDRVVSRLVVALVLAASLATVGCPSGDESPAPVEDRGASEESVEVPDLSGEDGADAVASVEQEGLSA